MDATREVYWNIRHVWVMYVLLVPTMVVASYGLYRRVRKWRQGQSTLRFDRPLLRLRRVLRLAILQTSIWREPLAGLMHGMLFWGFVTLTVATLVVFVHEDFQLRIMRGQFYLYFQSFFVDCLGAAAMLGVMLAAVRRWVLRPQKLVFTDQANWILILVFVILASGFLLEGWPRSTSNTS